MDAGPSAPRPDSQATPRPSRPLLPERSSGLPAPLTSLVGRARELALAQALLRRSEVRLVTLTGPGGIGKTRLALQLAADLAGAFDDGVRFVPLASVREADLVAAAIAHATGVMPGGDVALPEVLVAALQGADLLLVVDNFEHVLGAASVLSDLLAGCPGLKLLVTSRVLLRVAGEQALAVPPLGVPDAQATPTVQEAGRSPAVRLFAERAQAVDVTFALTETTAPQVAEICRLVDGLPLAIEVVAPRVRHVPLPTLRDRLQRRLPLLTGGSRDQPSRLQTMRNAIAWSHDLLTPEEQALFWRLGVFVGGFSLEAAEAIGGGEAGPGAPPVFDGLAALIDASLLQRESRPDEVARYRMLETIREFALERLEASGEATAVRDLHAAYFLTLAERYELLDLQPDGNRTLEVLEAEHANLRAALGWLQEAGEAGLLPRLAVALGRFWSSQGHYQEGSAWLERVVAPESAATSAERAKALVYLGMIEAYQGLNQDAETRLTVGLAGCRDVGATFHAAIALIFLGLLASQPGDHDRGTALLEEAITAAHDLADPRLERIVVGWVLANLATVARMRGDLALAAERLEAGLRLQREAGDAGGTILVMKDLGDLAREQGDHARALGVYQEALGLVRGSPGTRMVTEVIEMLGISAVAVGQAERGVRRLASTEAQRERIGLRFLLGMTQAALEPALAAARAALGDPAFATAWAAGRALRPGQAVAEALSPFESPAGAPDASLTPRETEILRLLAAGLTDPAIAEALFIGVRTVETHVAHILAKLGVRTRTAAVSVAVAAGLVAPGSPEPANPEATRSPGLGPHANP